jgi:hypothetical protein
MGPVSTGAGSIRFLVALPPVRDLLLRAKHLLLEADRVSHWRLLGEQERANIPRSLRRRREKTRALHGRGEVSFQEAPPSRRVYCARGLLPGAAGFLILIQSRERLSGRARRSETAGALSLATQIRIESRATLRCAARSTSYLEARTSAIVSV